MILFRIKLKCCILAIVVAVLFACNDDKVDYGYGEYYQEFATITTNKTYLLDNGKTLFDSGNEEHDFEKLKPRVLLTYSLNEDEEHTASDGKNIRVIGVSKIPCYDMQKWYNDSIATLTDEPVRLESLWLGSHYLNVQFYFEYYSRAHKIAFVCDRNSLYRDVVDIFFKHDTSGDPPGFPVFVRASFDLQKELGEPLGEKKLRIRFNTSNYGRKEYEFGY